MQRILPQPRVGTSRPLPPFGKRWIAERPSAGVVVVMGPDAWRKARGFQHAVMVLPDDRAPSHFRWPHDQRPALVIETGPANDARLNALAAELMRAGASSVVAIRESLLHADPRVFFVRELARAG